MIKIVETDIPQDDAFKILVGVYNDFDSLRRHILASVQKVVDVRRSTDEQCVIIVRQGVSKRKEETESESNQRSNAAIRITES